MRKTLEVLHTHTHTHTHTHVFLIRKKSGAVGRRVALGCEPALGRWGEL